MLSPMTSYSTISSPSSVRQYSFGVIRGGACWRLQQFPITMESDSLSLQDQLSEARSQLRESQYALRAQKLSYEERLLSLQQQLSQLSSDKAHLTMQAKLLAPEP